VAQERSASPEVGLPSAPDPGDRLAVEEPECQPHRHARTPTIRVVIAIDPHKASWTAVVVDVGLSAVAAVRVEVNRGGYRQLRRFAAGRPHARWAIEGAVGLGAPLTERLRADGITVIDVPAKLARRVRLLSTGHGRKSDQADTSR
jgi:hypothetical protein